MLLLLLHIENDRYALDTHYIEEIIPRLTANRLHYAPRFLSGIVNLRGRPVPVVDFGLLVGNKPCQITFYTRTIVIKNPNPHSELPLVGLTAEKVSETEEKDPAIFQPSGMESKTLPYLNKTDMSEQITYWIEISKLFNELEKPLLQHMETG